MVDNIIFPCPHCGKSLEVEPAGAGLIVKCPVCNKDVEIPNPPSDPSDPMPETAVSDAVPLPPQNISGETTSPVSDTAPVEKAGRDIPARRPFLFSIGVTLALIFSITAVVLLAITGWKFLNLARWESSRVEYAELAQNLTKKSPAWDVLSQGMSPALRKHFAAKERRPMLISWVDGLDEQARLEFCRNLELVAAEAQRQSNDVWRVINQYAKVKPTKLMMQNTIQRRTFRLKELTFATIGLFMMGIVLAVFAGVAVLLAVERNTRRTTMQ